MMMRFCIVFVAFVAGVAAKTVIKYDHVDGEMCGYDSDKTILHMCARGFICNSYQVCSTMVISRETVGAPCGVTAVGGAVTYICQDPLMCVDEKCVERDGGQHLLYKKEDVPPPRRPPSKREKGIVKRVWDMFK
jgi:hypothetical protein